MANIRGARIEVSCKNCGAAFTARTADRARGWARFCSKSCKAKKQEKCTGQYKAMQNSERDDLDFYYAAAGGAGEDGWCSDGDGD